MDVKANGFSSDIIGAAVGGLHDPRTAAGHDHQIVPVGALPAVSDEAPELASHIIILALGKEALRNFKPTCHVRVRRVGCLSCAQPFDLALNGRGLSNARSAKDNDRVWARGLL